LQADNATLPHMHFQKCKLRLNHNSILHYKIELKHDILKVANMRSCQNSVIKCKVCFHENTSQLPLVNLSTVLMSEAINAVNSSMHACVFFKKHYFIKQFFPMKHGLSVVSGHWNILRLHACSEAGRQSAVV